MHHTHTARAGVLEICSWCTTSNFYQFLPLSVGAQDYRLAQCSMGPRSVYPKEDLDPFSRFCTEKSRWAAWHTDRLTDTANIGNNSPRLMHWMPPKFAEMMSRVLRISRYNGCRRRQLLAKLTTDLVQIRRRNSQVHSTHICTNSSVLRSSIFSELHSKTFLHRESKKTRH